MASNYQLSHSRWSRELNPGLRGGRRECYHSATMARGIQPVSLFKLEVFDLAGAPVTALIASTTIRSSLERTLIGAPAQIISAYSMIGLI